MEYKFLNKIEYPKDLKKYKVSDLDKIAIELFHLLWIVGFPCLKSSSSIISSCMSVKLCNNSTDNETFNKSSLIFLLLLEEKKLKKHKIGLILLPPERI